MKKWLWLLLFGMVVGLMTTTPAMAQHSNALTWVQGNCPGCFITANSVYRTKTTGAGYAKIFTSTTGPVTAYTDTTPLGNDVNFYVVTATCLTCFPQESAFSLEIKTVTPADGQPGAPTSLTGVSK